MAAKEYVGLLWRLAHEIERDIDRARNVETSRQIVEALRAGALALQREAASK